MTEQKPRDLLAELKARTAREQALRKAPVEPLSNIVPIKREVPPAALLQNLANPEKPKRIVPASPADPSAPIELGPKDSARIGEAAVIAMSRLANGNAKIYQRGGMLVRPIEEPALDSKGRPTKVVSLVEFDAAAVKLLLMEHLRFQQNTRDGARYVNPGWELPNLIMKARGTWPFQVVTSLINAPTLRPDGSLLTASGYDERTGLLLLNPPAMPWVNPRPNADEARAALATLKELLAEFPFVDEASRSVVLSLILTVMVRGALDQVPLHLLTAPASGSGKSYLVDLASMIATGARAAVVAATRNEDELEKRMVGELIAGHPLVSLDNLNGVLASDLLCQAVTQDTMSIRPLGSSNVVKIANRSVMVANGNNIAIADDLARRTLMARLDAGQERPWERVFERNPVAMVAADRGRYIAAALTVVLAGLASGANERPAPVNGFERWSRFVRDPLVWLGEADPVVTMQAAREGDPRLQASIATLAAMADLFGFDQDRARTMPQIIEATTVSVNMVFALESKRKALREALMVVAGVGKEINPARLGTWLRQTKGRIVGGLKLCSEIDRHSKTNRWWVEPVRG